MTPLPIDGHIPDILKCLRENRNLVLTATPGAGKTTRLPPEFLKVANGQVLVLQPRRMAAVAACDRVSEERGWRTGEEVGYQVRFESRMSARTRLLFMTDALLLRRMIDDPELHGVGLVVLDEFHERSLNQDLLLGCLRELQELGRDLKIVVMSATLDVTPLLRFLPGSAHFDVPGVVFPLSIRHSQQPLRLQTDRTFFERVVQAAETAALETEGDVLVFLPGTGEIARVSQTLEERGMPRKILPLHGSLPLSAQREALAAPSTKRLILATNVAEASVTVQGVDFVIDTGLAKVMEMNPHSGFSSLELTRISQFNARQRAGRAARQKAGVCWRLWTSHEEVTQPRELPAEVQRADLSQALLYLANTGVSDFSAFAWLETPPQHLLQIAERFLLAAGALGPDRRLSELGRKLLRFPLPPRLGALLALADERGIGRSGAQIAALLNERDFADRPATTRDECDVIYRLGLLSEIANGQRPSGANLRQAQSVQDACRQLAKMVGNGMGDDLAIRKLILTSQKDRLCRRRGSSGRGLMAGGRGVRLDEESQVRASEFFVALQGVDLPGQTETLVGMACGLDKAFVLENLRAEIQVRDEIDFIEEKGQFFNRRVRLFRDLPLEEPTLTSVDPSQVGTQIVDLLTRKWDWLVQSQPELKAWMERWRFLLRLAPEYSDRLGPEQIGKTVAMAAYGKSKIKDVLAEDLVAFLELSMDKDVVRLLREEVPARFQAPSGVAHTISYGEEHSAFVEIRLQEIFGLDRSPKLVFGKAALTFRLLSPAFRPVQVTSDLASFWKSGYAEVRKELRLRYPKHAWPDDPMTAQPVAKGRRRPS